LLRVTFVPYLRTYTAMEILCGKLDGERVVQAAPGRAELNNQEFLLFRGVRSGADVEEFAGTYGLLGLDVAAREQVAAKAHMRPLWARALAKPPVHYRPGAEPIDDWFVQAGLMELAFGLFGLISDPQGQEALVEACKGVQAPQGVERLIAQARAAEASSSWPVRSILGGAAAAGLTCSAPHERWDKELDSPQTLVALRSVGWREIRRAGRVIRLPLDLELSTAGISEFLVRYLVRPWVERVPASVMVAEGAILPAYRMPVDLLGTLWLQLANAILSSVSPRVCAWQRCPGPPQRPGVFVWRWGRTDTGTKHRDALYCHPKCQHAAVVDRSRSTPGSRRRARSKP
jgi:hypothetical protein